LDARLTLRLPRALSEELERTAARLKRNRSDVARLALEQFLNAGQESNFRPIDRVRDLLCKFESGVSDLGTNHRDHLIRRLRFGK
jgi:Ribbon-helix-helix protein, copG family